MKNKIIIFLILTSFSGFGQGIYRTLPNVTNTADSMKPVSVAQKAAIVQKLQTVATKSALIAFTDATIANFDGSDWDKKSGNVASNGGVYSGTIINVNASFYWERRYKNGVDFRFFGAKLNGITDDTQSIQAAFDANLINYSFEFVKDFILISNEIVLNNYCKISGSQKKQGTVIRQITDNKSIFIVNQQFTEIADISFISNTKVGTVGVTVKASNTIIKNCWFESLYKAINTPVFAGNSDENNYFDTRVINCDYGVFIEQSNINTRINRCTFSGGKNAIWIIDTPTKPNEGVNISDCLIYLTGDNTTPALYIFDANFLILSNTMFDFISGTAISLNNSQFFKATSCYFSTNQSTAKNGVEMSADCSDAEFTNCHFFDCRKNGVELTGSVTKNIIFTNCTAYLNTSADILNNGCKNVQLIGCVLKSATGFIEIDNSGANPSATIIGGVIEQSLARGTATCEINMNNVGNFKTKKTGVATIVAGTNSISVPSGFNIILFQAVSVIATAANQESISASYNYSTNMIVLSRTGTTGSNPINFIAEVY